MSQLVFYRQTSRVNWSVGGLELRFCVAVARNGFPGLSRSLGFIKTLLYVLKNSRMHTWK